MLVQEERVKYFKELYDLVIGVALVVSLSINYTQSQTNELLETEVAQLSGDLIVARVDIRQAYDELDSHLERTPAVVSCANNQSDYINALINMEKKYNMPSGILQNIAYHESRYNPNAVSHAGAVGLMQIHPKWHKDVNPYNPYESIKYGAKYLQSLYDRFGNWKLALAAWNWGQGNLAKHSIKKAPRETRNFIKNVMTGVIV